jgi:hypothetical protein
MEDILGLSDGITSLTRRIAGGVEEVTAIASEPLHSGREEMLKAAGDKPKSPNTAA